MADWGCIPMDIAIKIAHHLKYHEDIELFGCVCSHWRSAAKQAKLSANKYKMPWLLLPDPEHDYTSNNRRQFYALFDRKVRTFNLPLDRRRLISSSQGWLLLASESRAADHLALVNPLSGVTINLPKVFCGIALITKMVLSGNPSTTLDFKVALILTHKPCPNTTVCYIIVATWSNGDDKWSAVKCRENMIDSFRFCNDITFYRGECYAVDNIGVVCPLGVSGDCGPYKYIGISSTADQPQTSYYLMESGDRLLVVCRIRSLVDIRDYRTWRTTRFYVYDLNVENEDVVWVPYLDRVAIFVGTNSSFSVEADGYIIKPNSIYFTDNYRFEYYDMVYDDDDKDMGVYNLADGSIESYYDGPSHYCKYAPFMWLDAPSS